MSLTISLEMRGTEVQEKASDFLSRQRKQKPEERLAQSFYWHFCSKGKAGCNKDFNSLKNCRGPGGARVVSSSLVTDSRIVLD